MHDGIETRFDLFDQSARQSCTKECALRNCNTIQFEAFEETMHGGMCSTSNIQLKARKCWLHVGMNRICVEIATLFDRELLLLENDIARGNE